MGIWRYWKEIWFYFLIVDIFILINLFSYGIKDVRIRVLFLRKKG